MLRPVVYFGLLAAVLIDGSCAHSRELKSVQVEVVPSSSIGLRFEAQKVEWVLGKIRIEGSVTNTSPDDYHWVEVVYTALDRHRKVLGREIWHVSPLDLKSGMRGEVDGDLIDTKGRIPILIEVEMSGELPE